MHCGRRTLQIWDWAAAGAPRQLFVLQCDTCGEIKSDRMSRSMINQILVLGCGVPSRPLPAF